MIMYIIYFVTGDSLHQENLASTEPFVSRQGSCYEAEINTKI